MREGSVVAIENEQVGEILETPDDLQRVDFVVRKRPGYHGKSEVSKL